jgi:hypothetical protein
VFVTGVFRVGLPVVALVVVTNWLMFSTADPYIRSLPGLRLKMGWLSVALLLVAAPVFGVVWGVLTWKANEWLYRRYMAQELGGGA